MALIEDFNKEEELTLPSETALGGLGLGSAFYANQFGNSAPQTAPILSKFAQQVQANDALRLGQTGFNLVNNPSVTSTLPRLMGSGASVYTGTPNARPVPGTALDLRNSIVPTSNPSTSLVSTAQPKGKPTASDFDFKIRGGGGGGPTNSLLGSAGRVAKLGLGVLGGEMISPTPMGDGEVPQAYYEQQAQERLGRPLTPEEQITILGVRSSPQFNELFPKTDEGQPQVAPTPETQASVAQAPMPVAQPQVVQEPEEPSFFEPGGFGYEYLGPRLGENFGDWAGRQKYGTDVTAEGQPTGHPVEHGTLLGDMLTLPGTALNVAGDFVTDPLVESGKIAKSAYDYAVGNNGAEAQREEAARNEQLKLGRQAFATGQGLDSVAGTQAAPVENMAPVDPNSPQADLLREQERLLDPVLARRAKREQAARAAQAMAAENLGLIGFNPKYNEQSLSDFLNYNDNPETPSGQFLDPQGRLRQRSVGTNELTPQYGSYEKQSDLRDKRMEQNFGNPRGPDSTDRGSGISRAKALRLAEGDKALADRMITLDRMGYDPVSGTLVQPNDTRTDDQKALDLLEIERRKQVLEQGGVDPLDQDNQRLRNEYLQTQIDNMRKSEPTKYDEAERIVRQHLAAGGQGDFNDLMAYHLRLQPPTDALQQFKKSRTPDQEAEMQGLLAKEQASEATKNSAKQ